MARDELARDFEEDESNKKNELDKLKLALAEAEAEIARLRDGIIKIFLEYQGALTDGCDSNGAYDVAREFAGELLKRGRS
jgi:hypothetical protein